MSMMCAWSVSRSNIALQSRAFGNIVFHSETGKLVVTITADCSARPEITWNSNSAADSGTATYAEAKYDFRLEFVVDRAEVGGGRGVGAGPPREPGNVSTHWDCRTPGSNSRGGLVTGSAPFLISIRKRLRWRDRMRASPSATARFSIGPLCSATCCAR